MYVFTYQEFGTHMTFGGIQGCCLHHPIYGCSDKLMFSVAKNQSTPNIFTAAGESSEPTRARGPTRSVNFPVCATTRNYKNNRSADSSLVTLYRSNGAPADTSSPPRRPAARQPRPGLQAPSPQRGCTPRTPRPLRARRRPRPRPCAVKGGKAAVRPAGASLFASRMARLSSGADLNLKI